MSLNVITNSKLKQVMAAIRVLGKFFFFLKQSMLVIVYILALY
jgi:hypothetical protein